MAHACPCAMKTERLCRTAALRWMYRCRLELRKEAMALHCRDQRRPDCDPDRRVLGLYAGRCVYYLYVQPQYRRRPGFCVQPRREGAGHDDAAVCAVDVGRLSAHDGFAACREVAQRHFLVHRMSAVVEPATRLPFGL